jgi:hypothetical protein
MSGTFFINNYMDLETQAKFIARPIYDEHQWWLQNRRIRSAVNTWREDGVVQIKRKHVESIIGLPKLTIHPPNIIEMTPEVFRFQEPLSNSLKRMMLQKNKEHILQRITFLSEILDHPALIKDEELLERYSRPDFNIPVFPSNVHSHKTKWIEDLIKKKLKEDPKTQFIVYSRFAKFLAGILCSFLEKIPGVKTGIICGGQKEDDRQQVIESFRVDPDIFPEAKHINILLSSIKSGGLGLNLTTGNRKGVIILAEPQWNPATEMQSIYRIHRMGQQNPVEVYSAVTKDSLEFWVNLLTKKKSQEAEEWEHGNIIDARRKVLRDEIILAFRSTVIGISKEEKTEKQRELEELRQQDIDNMNFNTVDVEDDEDDSDGEKIKTNTILPTAPSWLIEDNENNENNNNSKRKQTRIDDFIVEKPKKQKSEIPNSEIPETPFVKLIKIDWEPVFQFTEEFIKEQAKRKGLL